MTPERWRQIEDIFHAALERDEPERSKFVANSGVDDTELVDEVQRLLSQFEDASSFIEQPLYDSGKTGVLSSLLDDADDDPMVGMVLGNYRIEREIGRGGMGAVYEARRADGEFRLRVALKVVKRGVDTDFVLRRFRNERQILAALDHPYITRLIDGGSTDDGRPYFVMEYIDGYPLYRYCDKKKLSLVERLRLFCRVTEAVIYAHQKRVIHRDLKPSNIFITNDGSPRLLDFGIAKLLDPDMASDTLHPTATALRMMTVDYASPEQVRGERVTYATDIYSLGVILFELLTGYRPYKLVNRSSHEVARAICEDQPAIASEVLGGFEDMDVVRVSPSAPTLADTIGEGGDSGSSLSAEVRGNLDNIIGKALRKKPEDRYETVAELRRDIERHLNGESVTAPRPDAQLAPPAPPPQPPGKLLAVLPLSLMSPARAGNTDEAYLTVGLADAMITRLAAVRQLTVRPTSSITRYNEHQINPFRAGRELGVDYVLDGRIRRFGDRLRVSLQLLDVHSTSAIWAGQFDEHLTDVLELEDAISEQVAKALIPQLTGEDKQKLAKRGTNNPRAFEAYIRGRFYWNQFTAHSFPKALEAFQLAVDIDPSYALAHVGIADFYIWANIYGLVTAEETKKHAEAAARHALQIDDELGEAYASMGLVELNRFNFEKAERLFRRAIELNPHYPLVHEWYAALLVGIGRTSSGIEEMHEAETLDPLSLRTKIMVGWTCFQAGDIDTALSKAEEAIELDYNYPQGHIQRGYYLCDLGRADEAVEELELSNRMMPGSSLAQFNLCFGYAAAGRINDATKIADSMFERARAEYIKPMFLFFAAFAVGRVDEAFRQLEIAVEEQDPWLIWLGTDKKLEPLRSDPRFLSLLERTGKTFVDGATRPLAGLTQHTTGGAYHEAKTIPYEDSHTGPVKRGFIRRNKKLLAASLVVIILIGAAYLSGFLTVRFEREPAVSAGPVAPGLRSIAVLPFRNATGDPANEYISEGMNDSLISRMIGSSEIRMIPKSASSRFRDSRLDIASIGRELSAENVISGELRKDGEDFVLSLEMTRVSDGQVVLRMGFSEAAGRIFALQDTMITRVAEALKLSADGAVATRKSYTENNEAFQLYLRGEYSRQRGTPAGIVEALDHYKQAVNLDPNYALAHQGLALTYRSAPAYGSMAPADAYPMAIASAQRALDIDPSMSTAHVALASVKATYEWDFAGAEAAYRRAIQLAPNNSEAHFSLGNFLVAMGRGDEGLVEYRNALQIDPLSLNVQTNIGWAYYIEGRYDEALAQIREVLARDPGYSRAYMNLGEILQEQGKYGEAIAAIQKAREGSKDPLTDMALGHVYAVAGRKAEAQAVALDLENKVRLKQVSPFLPAVVYAGLKDNDKAFYWLERAYQERSNWLTLIKVGRRLSALRPDPRFDDLLKRIGFPD